MIGLTQLAIVAGILACVFWLVAGRHIVSDFKAEQARRNRRRAAAMQRHPAARVQTTRVEHVNTLHLPMDCYLSRALLGHHGPEAQAAAERDVAALARWESELAEGASS